MPQKQNGLHTSDKKQEKASCFASSCPYLNLRKVQLDPGAKNKLCGWEANMANTRANIRMTKLISSPDLLQKYTGAPGYLQENAIRI